MPFPPDPCFERCPRPFILLSEGHAIDLTMDMYPTRYLEEIWPDYWDDVDTRLWFCPRCSRSLSATEDQRCPICDADLVPPSDEEEGYA